MIHSHRRKTSRNLFFRMDVPADVRGAAGVTSWQRSLGTSDPTLADARRAELTAHYKGEVLRLRGIARERSRQDAARLVRRALEKLARYFHGSMDAAVASQLGSLARIVRSGWSVDHARALEVELGHEPDTTERNAQLNPGLAFADERDQRLFCTRARLLERQPETEGLVYQELARKLLATKSHRALSGAVSYLPYLEPAIDLGSPTAYDAIAEAYLTLLSEHRFTSWPEDIREALVPVAMPEAGRTESPLATAITPPNIVTALAATAPADRTVWDAFQAWKDVKRITGKHKTADEFRTALARFVELIGTDNLALITPRMVKDFRRAVSDLPARPGPEIDRLPLRVQIERARAQGLPRLSPPTIGKHVAGLRTVLKTAVDAEWIASNPAAGITVEGSKWEGDERDHFSDEDMRRIYTSALMTEPDACDDTMFWHLFLAPFHGSRPGEHSKLKPDDISLEGGNWIMRFRRDRRGRTAKIDETTRRRQKTSSSVRDVPLHWILIEAGFVEFVDLQRAKRAEWVFDDLEPDAYGDRYKSLSQRINRALRKIGIAELDKAFYSTRHSMKREGRRLRISKESLDQLAGHAGGDVGSRYGQGMPMEVLKNDIDRLEFRTVPWDAVVACALARLDRKRKGG